MTGKANTAHDYSGVLKTGLAWCATTNQAAPEEPQP
jgi:hypothetical protein